MAEGSYNSKKDKVLVKNSPENILESSFEETGSETERGEEYKSRNRGRRAIKQKVSQYLGANPKLRGLQIKDLDYTPREGSSYQLSKIDIAFLVGTSLLFDAAGGLLSLIDFVLPPVGTFMEKVTVFPVSTLTLWFMFKKRGVNFLDRAATKKLLAFYGTRVVGFIPLLSVIPEYTFSTIFMILVLKGEEVTGLKDALEQNPEIAKMLSQYLK